MLLALLLLVRSRILLTLLLLLSLEDDLPRLTGNLKSLPEEGDKDGLVFMFESGVLSNGREQSRDYKCRQSPHSPCCVTLGHRVDKPSRLPHGAQQSCTADCAVS